jgi:hypothetical protein
MALLRFSFDDFLKEIISMQDIAAPFLDASAGVALRMLRSTLENIRTTPPDKNGVWEIPEHTPLRTKTTRGYEPGGRGGEDVIGEITSRWTICPWTDRQLKKGRPVRFFCLTGNASIRVRILSANDVNGEHTELAMWRMELGTEDSPGCFFHIQVLGHKQDPPFPRSLSVPRLPALAFTPMAALEFLLGELFQDEWKRRAAAESGPMGIWRSIQRDRLQNLLAWKMERVRDCAGSPWAALKSAKPDRPDMFIC